MTAYDVLDEATITAAPAEVVEALLDEAAGRSHWWQPYLRMRQRGDRPPTEIGAVVDITVAGGLAQFGARQGVARPATLARAAKRELLSLSERVYDRHVPARRGCVGE